MCERDVFRGASPDPLSLSLCGTEPYTHPVLLVDDQAMVRARYHMMLDAEPDIEVVGEAQDGVSPLEAASSMHPDFVLVDIEMPVMDGLEATHRFE